jgi:hypothetical protein
MSKRKIAETPLDPTLPSVSVEIDGTTYRLVFDLGSLAEAEAAFVAQGHDVNLLRALPVLNVSSVRIIFACAVKKFHPELGFEEAKNLVNFPSLYVVAAAVTDAWSKSVPEPTPEGEEQPGE